MSNPAQQDWLLKVIAGPHQGAELLLESDQTLIGSDDECDVVFHDVLVAPQHVSLVLDGGALFAEPLGGRVFIDGKRIRDARQQVEEFSFITIGGTHFVLGRESSTWPLLSAADLPDLEKEAPEPSGESKEGSSEKAEGIDASETAAAKLEDGEADAQAAAVNKKSAWFMVGVGCVLLLGSLYAWQRLDDVGLTPQVELTLKERAEILLSDLGVEKEVQIEQAGDRLTATGYVKSDDVSRELQAKLRQELPGIRTRIWSLDRIANSARNMLAQQKLGLQVEGLPEGELKIFGKVADAQAWEKAKQMLGNEVPGVSNIIDQVQVKPQAIAMKSNPSVVEKLVPVPVHTQTSVPTEGAQELMDSTSEMQPVAEASLDDSRSIQFIQVSADDFSWVKLDDGSVLFLGAKLRDGSTLIEITKTNMIVLKEGEKRVIKLGDPILKTSTLLKSAELNRVE